MPAPAAKTPVAKRTLPAPSASTQPLTVDAGGEGVETAPVVTEPTAEEIVALAQSAPDAAPKKAPQKPPFVENADGTITIEFDYPVDVSNFGIPNMTTLNGLTMQPATWKKRRAAARRYPANATPLDQDTCLITELTGYPEHILDAVDGRDMSLVQAALGKFIYSPRMFSEG